MKKYFKTTIAIIFTFNLMLQSCTKADEWLDVKANNTDVVPTTMKDFQAILDYDLVMNSSEPTLGILSADSYYYTDAVYASRAVNERNSYIWQKDIFEGAPSNEWSNPYRQILYANVVLEGIHGFTSTASTQNDLNQMKGSALFFRSFTTYKLLQLFAPNYREVTASTDLGVPLKLESYIYNPVGRPSVKDCYLQITKDLEEAVSLLPVSAIVKSRPSRTAAFALLSKIWLLRGDYGKASVYADSVIAINSNLLDFNSLNATASFSLPTFQIGNSEVLFYSTGTLTAGMLSAYADSTLYRSYATNDLRKTLLYKLSGTLPQFKGSYSGGNNPFTGIGLNEIYFIRAESRARTNNLTGAMADLNAVLIKRWKTGTYVNSTVASADIALKLILTEKRKELAFSGSNRWEELRRLNDDPVFAITLKRVVNGVEYTLAPASIRYVLPIPDNEIRLSGITQNLR